MVPTRLLFYFAGHGETETLADNAELGYLAPTDAPLRDVDPRGLVNGAISMHRVAEAVTRMRYKHASSCARRCRTAGGWKCH